MNIIGRFFLSWSLACLVGPAAGYFQHRFSQPDVAAYLAFMVVFTGGVAFVVQALLTLAWIEKRLRHVNAIGHASQSRIATPDVLLRENDAGQQSARLAYHSPGRFPDTGPEMAAEHGEKIRNGDPSSQIAGACRFALVCYIARFRAFSGVALVDCAMDAARVKS